MRTGVLHVWNSRGCNQDQRERRNTNKFRSRWRVLHLAEMRKTCERDRWETPNEPDLLDTRMLSSCDKDSWKVINDLRARFWFDRFNSSGLRIAPSCKQHPQRPGAFVRSAWARGSFPGRIYRHPEQRFKGNKSVHLHFDAALFPTFLSELFFSARAQESLHSWTTAVNNAEIIFENVNILTRDIQVRFHAFLFSFRWITSDFELIFASGTRSISFYFLTFPANGSAFLIAWMKFGCAECFPITLSFIGYLFCLRSRS